MKHHTLGPWSVLTNPANGRAEFIRTYRGDDVLDVASVLCDETNNANANARLIALAPELYEALLMVDRIWSRDWTDAIEPDSPLGIVRATLAKVAA